MTTIRRTWRRDGTSNLLSIHRAVANYTFANGYSNGSPQAAELQGRLRAGEVLMTPLAVYALPGIDVSADLFPAEKGTP